MSITLFEKSDEEIARLIQEGGNDALEILIDRYSPKLLRYGKKFLSNEDATKDIVQEVFIKVYQNIKSFDTKRSFSPWIYRIAHNSFANYLRNAGKEPVVALDLDVFLEYHVYDDPAIEQKEKEEIGVLLEKGLLNLPLKYKEVLVLHYFEDLSYQEIADILHVPIGTVGIRLRRAREALKVHLQNHE